ncbi:hypothetical protein JCM11491_004605 [Sporobolomyces phaffii]
MKFALSTLLALFVATTSVSAACQQRRRSTIPSSHGSFIERRGIDPMISTPKELVRRHKGGKRLDRRGPPAGPLGDRPAGRGGNRGANGSNSQSSPSSMTSARASQQTGNVKGQSASSSSSSPKAVAQTTRSSSSSAAQSTSTGTSSSSTSGSSYSGDATFYYQNGVAGACGGVASDSDKVVALQTSMYGSGGYCGKTITITNTATGASTTATVADECPSCSSSTSIDLSTGAFDAIGSEDTGVLQVTWSFNVSRTAVASCLSQQSFLTLNPPTRRAQ